MSHTVVNALFHCVFGTKGRRQLITASLQERLWPFMGGIASPVVPTGRMGMKGKGAVCGPSDESLGYCQTSLRDVSTDYRFTAAWRRAPANGLLRSAIVTSARGELAWPAAHVKRTRLSPEANRRLPWGLG